jgi:hypothetical protein
MPGTAQAEESMLELGGPSFLQVVGGVKLSSAYTGPVKELAGRLWAQGGKRARISAACAELASVMSQDDLV